ncbi:MAG: glycoside hydrolase family 38 N-terminal domain-containing protein [Planctomycetota bacterium]|jgi:alpha-mannosidase
MPKENKTLHLICNAHIDPVWLWEMPEGAAAAISTFRTAAELCRENDSFVFNHNEVILYEWVRQYEPALFEEIQSLVKAGKWHIMGGWYLQPDCNMPSGESFVRQILTGREYFKKHFNAAPTTAINFDPFGHTRGLVQILAKMGYDSYLFGRPDQNDCPLPADEFLWVGYDGSEIMGTRFRDWYNSPLGKAREKIEARLEQDSNAECEILLWGVGNHGGGPSRIDVRNVNKLIEQTESPDIRHSTPDAYFKQLKRNRDKLPRHDKDLNPWAVGGYTSQIRIKQKHRKLENEIYSLEKMASAAAVNKLVKYPAEQIQEALRDLMTGQFHDIMPGSSIQTVEEDSLQILDHGLEIAAREKTRAFYALAAGQPRASKGRTPIMVYNPHPFKIRTIVECEFHLADTCREFTRVTVNHKGSKLPSQVEQEASNIPLDWRKRVAFLAELGPSRMNRFDCALNVIDKKPPIALKPKNGKILFKTKELEVAVNCKTGLIDTYKVKGRNCIGKNAFEPIVIKDDPDPWGMLTQSYGKLAGRFKLMSAARAAKFSAVTKAKLRPVRVIEDGPARTIVEALFAYGDSFICQRCALPKRGTEVEVQTRVYWNEKDRMLKLSIPTLPGRYEYLGQVAYGTGRLPANGNEAVAQKWVAAVNRSKDLALTCINDGIYGSDFSKDGLRLTLLRSPAYSCHPDEAGRLLTPVNDRFTPRIDQGERNFTFWFNAGKVKSRLENIDREALAKNEKPFALSFFPSGKGKKPKPIAVLSDKVVQITTLKKAQTNNDLLIRLFEPTGRPRKTILSLPFAKKKMNLSLKPFEIRTLRFSPRTGKTTETDLLEKPLKK